MSNQRRVLKNVLGSLKKMLPTAKQGYTVSLAMLVTGIVLEKTAKLSKIRVLFHEVEELLNV